MRKITVPLKDASLYQAFPTKNTGLDEILEVGKAPTVPVQSYVSASARSLLAFDLTEYASITSSVSYFLNLKLANASNVVRGQTLVVAPVSTSWAEGSGYFNQAIRIAEDGATWQQAQRNVSWSLAGGDQLASPTASIQLTEFPLQDLRIDITPLVQQTDTKLGLIIKLPEEDEQDSSNATNLKFFSSQTHTIHAPYVEAVWSSQVFNTGSLKPIPNLYVKVSLSGASEIYTKGDVSKILISVRDQFPIKTFDATPRYGNKYYLPQTSYFSVEDEQTKETVIRGDQFSPVECDGTSSYMILDTSPLYIGRFYRIKLHVTHNGMQKTIDPNIMFRVV